MNELIYRIKGALATLFLAIIGWAILSAAFEDWYSGVTSLRLRFSEAKLVTLSAEPSTFYAVLSIYTLLGLSILFFAVYLAYKTIFATPEAIERTASSSRFFFGKSDPGLLWFGGILILAFLFLMVKTQFGF